MPAANISIANPISARKAVVGSAGSSQRKPLIPITTPARSSPTTTGRSACLPNASSGPARPARTIRARTPNVIRLIVPQVLRPAGRAARVLRRGSVRGGGEGRLKSIEEGNLRCLQPSACLIEGEPLDAVDLGECLDDA